MDEYMGDFLFDTFQPFHFYHDATVDYFIPVYDPQDGGHCKDTYTKYIETLPLANSPGVFGLHSNAEIGYYTKATKEVRMVHNFCTILDFCCPQISQVDS